MSSREKGEILASRLRRLISNRVAYGMSALKMGTFRRCGEDKKQPLWPPASPLPMMQRVNHFIRNVDMEGSGGFSITVDFTERRYATKIWRGALCPGKNNTQRGKTPMTFFYYVMRGFVNPPHPPFRKPFGAAWPLVIIESRMVSVSRPNWAVRLTG